MAWEDDKPVLTRSQYVRILELVIETAFKVSDNRPLLVAQDKPFPGARATIEWEMVLELIRVHRKARQGAMTDDEEENDDEAVPAAPWKPPANKPRKAVPAPTDDDVE